MVTLGGLIRLECYRQLGTMFTFEMSIRKDHMLVTSGPYGIVRHPGYTGILLVISGMLLLHASEVSLYWQQRLLPLNVSQGSWLRESGVLNIKVIKIFLGFFCGLVATMMVGLLSRMSKEDKALYLLAGKEWEDWAERVPYRLFPSIYWLPKLLLMGHLGCFLWSNNCTICCIKMKMLKSRTSLSKPLKQYTGSQIHLTCNVDKSLEKLVSSCYTSKTNKGWRCRWKRGERETKQLGGKGLKSNKASVVRENSNLYTWSLSQTWT